MILLFANTTNTKMYELKDFKDERMSLKTLMTNVRNPVMI